MTDLPRLPKNCTRTLHAAGITSLEECATWPRDEVGKLRHVGPRMLGILEACVQEIGLSFDDDSPYRAEPVNRAITHHVPHDGTVE